HQSEPSGSTHTKPSLTFAVKSKGSDEETKEPQKATAFSPGPSVSSTDKPVATSSRNPNKYVAIDCEMVGTGPKRLSELARCSIVSYEGDVIYDQFIRPASKVTDYRTRWSGIRRADLINATPFAQARMEIMKLIKGKVVVGHAVHNDFKVIGYSHPPELIRDTSQIPLLNQKAGIEGNSLLAAALHLLQTGNRGHSSVEDARATMELYKVVEHEWERHIGSHVKMQTRFSAGL
uniref:Interferon stimulated exonuclease 20 like 2 n=1 Tax=Amphilophus citrinellus TaxID=61819 RepID=A0A3Q0REJ3_AMPCI